ncbi:tyrosine-type recombinase/integrase [Amycolatopsis magusensis]|uniref:tyrosine-type recombinase/integrase n=1 Tax=Amycolatopsis magusensis TaxID=882444 RepID=UPI0024A90937|nr:tyrosine-type recombinase/integrase [Amycolatopsis magusensis]MDI5979600.1 tyrosine-type recombinase/integrase [Amycolatopsis magusensis]
MSSGRWQARYPGPDGLVRKAPETFSTKRDAERWLSLVETQIAQSEWVAPERAEVTIEQYATLWIDQRPGLRPRTVELYKWLLRKHITPYLGGVQLGKLSTVVVRQWRAERLAAGVSESVMAKSYRLLRSVLNTAVDEDKIIQKNPCRVRGADRENPEERPVLSVAQVFDLASRMPERFRALVLLAAFGSLRWGEVSALRRCDVAEDASWVRVSRALVEVPGRGLIVGPPKSRAGVRTVIIPAAVRPKLVKHLETFVKGAPEALLFTGERDGNAVRRPNFSQRTRWTEVVTKMGLKGLHFHDLRHAGNIWASKAGTSTKDLMARMGHDDMRAALIYQRATSEADEQIADRLSKLIDRHRRGATPADEDDDGQPAPVG